MGGKRQPRGDHSTSPLIEYEGGGGAGVDGPQNQQRGSAEEGQGAEETGGHLPGRHWGGLQLVKGTTEAHGFPHFAELRYTSATCPCLTGVVAAYHSAFCETYLLLMSTGMSLGGGISFPYLNANFPK